MKPKKTLSPRSLSRFTFCVCTKFQTNLWRLWYTFIVFSVLSVLELSRSLLFIIMKNTPLCPPEYIPTLDLIYQKQIVVVMFAHSERIWYEFLFYNPLSSLSIMSDIGQKASWFGNNQIVYCANIIPIVKMCRFFRRIFRKI